MALAQFQSNPRVSADVELLLGRFRDLIPDGRLVAHEEIESLLQITRKTSRYRTVVSRWRKVLFTEQRVFLDGRAALGRGFVSLTPDEMIRYTDRSVRAVGRALRKAIAIAALPDPSELKNSETRTYQARLLVAVEQIYATHKRTLVDLSKALQPPRQLPRAASSR